MKKSRVLFVGGSVSAAVKIRCIDIAEALGCDHVENVDRMSKIPRGYSAYIFVKTLLHAADLRLLSSSSKVIVDVIDGLSVNEYTHYIVSSLLVKDIVDNAGGTSTLIRHHHCNYENEKSSAKSLSPVWIGSTHWIPKIGVPLTCMCAETRHEAVDAYKRAGIILNIRSNETGTARQHVRLNSGLKLINCIGFGIPSVSDFEPAYAEIGSACTIFSSHNDRAYWIHELQTNERLYSRLKLECLKLQDEYSLRSSVKRYTAFIDSL